MSKYSQLLCYSKQIFSVWSVLSSLTFQFHVLVPAHGKDATLTFFIVIFYVTVFYNTIVEK